jgi:putative flippase GtrA
MKLRVPPQFLSFLLAGGLAALFNWGSRFVFSLWFELEVAVILAFFVGLASGFVLMRWFVFKQAETPLLTQAGWYVLINLMALAQTWLITVGLARYALPAIGFTWHAEALAHLTGILAPIASSYLGHRFLTFK